MGIRRGARILLPVVLVVVSLFIVVGGVAALLAARGADSPPSPPPPPPESLIIEYVALGDSFAAGQGGGGYAGECLQSDAGYPALLGASNRIDLVADGSCTGATTADVRATQVSLVPRDTDLVTVTVGGNDLDAVGVAVICAAAPGSPECEAALGTALALLNSGVLADRLAATFADIEKRAPDAALVVTGYPFLFADRAVDDPTFRGVSALNEATSALNHTLLAVVADAADAGRAACFVDVTRAFAGHGIGSTDPFVLADGPDAYHPTAEGYRAYAAAIDSALPCIEAG